jgi:hypothetical protein
VLDASARFIVARFVKRRIGRDISSFARPPRFLKMSIELEAGSSTDLEIF